MLKYIRAYVSISKARLNIGRILTTKMITKIPVDGLEAVGSARLMALFAVDDIFGLIRNTVLN